MFRTISRTWKHLKYPQIRLVYASSTHLRKYIASLRCSVALTILLRDVCLCPQIVSPKFLNTARHGLLSPSVMFLAQVNVEYHLVSSNCSTSYRSNFIVSEAWL